MPVAVRAGFKARIGKDAKFILSSLPLTLTMLARQTIRSFSSARPFSSTASRHSKVAVLGAGGGIGQPLSLLLKTDKLVTSLSLYDIRGAPGVGADVSHVDTASEVSLIYFLRGPSEVTESINR
jgi:hypothetical protein